MLLDALRAAVASPDVTLRVAAADAAGADGSKEAADAVLGLLLDPAREARVAAATALLPTYEGDIRLYSPDAPEPERRAVVDRIRKRDGH